MIGLQPVKKYTQFYPSSHPMNEYQKCSLSDLKSSRNRTLVRDGPYRSGSNWPCCVPVYCRKQLALLSVDIVDLRFCYNGTEWTADDRVQRLLSLIAFNETVLATLKKKKILSRVRSEPLTL